MNEKEFNGLILAELVKIANDVFTNEIEIAPRHLYRRGACKTERCQRERDKYKISLR